MVEKVFGRYAKATTAFGSLLVAGVALVLVGSPEAGVAMISSAPVVSGLVALTSNKASAR
jgi:hypothetical protein